MAGPNLFSTHLSTTDTDTQQELSSEEKISKAVKREQAALRQAREAKQKLSAVQNDQERGAAEESQRLALLAVRDEKHFILRERLQKAVKLEKLNELVPAVAAVRQEDVPNCSELVTEVRLENHFLYYQGRINPDALATIYGVGFSCRGKEGFPNRCTRIIFLLWSYCVVRIDSIVE